MVEEYIDPVPSERRSGSGDVPTAAAAAALHLMRSAHLPRPAPPPTCPAAMPAHLLPRNPPLPPPLRLVSAPMQCWYSLRVAAFMIRAWRS